MTTQINLRFPEELLGNMKTYAQSHGYLNVQEFIRDTVRDKIYEDFELKEDYKKVLKSNDATTFISDKEADELDKQLIIQSNLE